MKYRVMTQTQKMDMLMGGHMLSISFVILYPTNKFKYPRSKQNKKNLQLPIASLPKLVCTHSSTRMDRLVL